MTQALVPYDPNFPDPTAVEAYRWLWLSRWCREQAQAMFQGLADVMRQIGEAIIEPLVEAFRQIGRTMTEAWLLPPDPADLLHGKRWRSPVTGVQYRVAGRPGNRHWIETGPRGWRRR